MVNPVLAESGRLALSTAMELHHRDGSVTETRGTVARLPESVDDLAAPAGLNCWVSRPTSDSVVDVVMIEKPDGTMDEYETLDPEPTSGALYGSIAHDTIRFSLRSTDRVLPPAPVPEVFFGWSQRRAITTADLNTRLARINGDDDFEGEWPPNSVQAYLFAAVKEAEGEPNELYRPPNPFNQIHGFPRQAGTINDADGGARIVIVSFSLFTVSSAARPVRIGFGATPPQPPVTSPTLYFGWSTSSTIVTADLDDSLARVNSDTDFTNEWPPNGMNAYVFVAVPQADGVPTEVYRPPNPFNQIIGFRRQTGTVDDPNGNPHIVIVSQSLFAASPDARPVRVGFA